NAPARDPYPLPTFALILPYSREGACSNTVGFSDDPGPTELADGWRYLCTTRSQSSVVFWVGTCEFSLWRGPRQLAISPDQNKGNVSFVDDFDPASVQNWRSEFSETIEAEPLRHDERPGLLRAVSGLGIADTR